MKSYPYYAFWHNLRSQLHIFSLVQRNAFQQPFTEARNPLFPLSPHLLFHLPRRGHPIFVRTAPSPSNLACLEEDIPEYGGTSLNLAGPLLESHCPGHSDWSGNWHMTQAQPIRELAWEFSDSCWSEVWRSRATCDAGLSLVWMTVSREWTSMQTKAREKVCCWITFWLQHFPWSATLLSALGTEKPIKCWVGSSSRWVLVTYNHRVLRNTV